MASQAEIIRLLRNERKWAAIPVGKKNIQMSRRLSGKAVTVILEAAGNGKFNLRPATYRFRSSCSHFDYSVGEQRFSRNKGVFKSLFKALRESAIAGYIENLDTFLVINKGNQKSHKGKLKKELAKITER